MRFLLLFLEKVTKIIGNQKPFTGGFPSMNGLHMTDY